MIHLPALSSLLVVFFSCLAICSGLSSNVTDNDRFHDYVFLHFDNGDGALNATEFVTFASTIFTKQVVHSDHTVNSTCPSAKAIFNDSDINLNSELDRSELTLASDEMMLMILQGCEQRKRSQSDGDDSSEEDEDSEQDILIASKVTLICVIGFLTFGASLLPWLIKRLKFALDIMYISSCFAAGVILGAGFSHILPDASESFDSYFEQAGPAGLADSDDVEYPFAELIAVATLLALVFVDKYLVEKGLGHSHGEGEGGGHHNHHSHMVVLLPPEYEEKRKAEKEAKRKKKELLQLQKQQASLGDVEMGVMPSTRGDDDDESSVVGLVEHSDDCPHAIESRMLAEQIDADDESTDVGPRPSSRKNTNSDRERKEEDDGDEDEETSSEGDNSEEDVIELVEKEEGDKKKSNDDDDDDDGDDDDVDDKAIVNEPSNDKPKEFAESGESEFEEESQLEKHRGTRAKVGQAWVFFIALSLHSIFDGLGLGAETSVTSFYGLLIAVLGHKLLDGFSLGVPLFFARLPAWQTIFALVFCSCMTPLGVGMGWAASSGYDGAAPTLVQAIILSITAGSFCFISLIELLPSGLADGRFVPFKLAACVLGWGLMAIIALWV